MWGSGSKVDRYSPTSKLKVDPQLLSNLNPPLKTGNILLHRATERCCPSPKEIKTSWIGPGPGPGPAVRSSLYNIPVPPADIWAAAPNLALVFYVPP